MTLINPYLNFNGQCREAMTFYQACLGGELLLQKIAESPMAAQMPSEAGAQILRGSLKKEGILLIMGSDMIGSHLRAGNSVTLCLNCSSDEELTLFFERLSAGGQIRFPPHQSLWGSTFGELTDKFGISWVINYSKN
jgi:PhnB protein